MSSVLIPANSRAPGDSSRASPAGAAGWPVVMDADMMVKPPVVRPGRGAGLAVCGRAPDTGVGMGRVLSAHGPAGPCLLSKPGRTHAGSGLAPHPGQDFHGPPVLQAGHVGLVAVLVDRAGITRLPQVEKPLVRSGLRLAIRPPGAGLLAGWHACLHLLYQQLEQMLQNFEAVSRGIVGTEQGEVDHGNRDT